MLVMRLVYYQIASNISIAINYEDIVREGSKYVVLLEANYLAAAP